MGRVNFEGEGHADDTDVSCAETAEPIEMLFGLWTQVGPKKHVLDWGYYPHAKGSILLG